MKTLELFFEEIGISYLHSNKKTTLFETFKKHLTEQNDFSDRDDCITTEVLIFDFFNSSNGFIITQPSRYFSPVFLNPFPPPLLAELFSCARFFYNPLTKKFTCSLDSEFLIKNEIFERLKLCDFIIYDPESSIRCLFMSEYDKHLFLSQKTEKVLAFLLTQSDLSSILHFHFSKHISKQLNICVDKK